jgi:hypothetical protein
MISDARFANHTPGFESWLGAQDQVLRRYTQGLNGYFFTTRAGRVLDARNSLKALHGACNRGGFHAFRRFRFSVFRRAGVPDNLIEQGLGHSQSLVDLYATQDCGEGAGALGQLRENSKGSDRKKYKTGTRREEDNLHSLPRRDHGWC